MSNTPYIEGSSVEEEIEPSQEFSDPLEQLCVSLGHMPPTPIQQSAAGGPNTPEFSEEAESDEHRTEEVEGLEEGDEVDDEEEEEEEEFDPCNCQPYSLLHLFTSYNPSPSPPPTRKYRFNE